MPGFYYRLEPFFNSIVRLYHRKATARRPDSDHEVVKEVETLARTFNHIVGPNIDQNQSLLLEDATILRLAISMSCVVDRYIPYHSERHRQFIANYAWYIRIERFRSRYVRFDHVLC